MWFERVIKVLNDSHQHIDIDKVNNYIKSHLGDDYLDKASDKDILNDYNKFTNRQLNLPVYSY